MSEVRRVVKKRKKRQMTPIFKLIVLSVFIAGVFFSYSVFSEIYKTIELKQQLAQVEKQLQEIKDENVRLTSQKDKLEDPNYVQSYARGNYMLTKDGEEIFYLPSSVNE